MNRPHRSIEIFTMSALDLFVTAMGSFAILMMILFPYYKADRKEQARKEAERQGNVLFCEFTTRVKDFEHFRTETEPSKDPNRENKWVEWLFKEPGHEQGPDFPATQVSWNDAQAFCRWLTDKERQAGLIGPNSFYRLPTSAEWALAAGSTKYVWGEEMPPPKGAGNFGGNEYSQARGYSRAPNIMGDFRDEHEMHAPVGQYTPTRDGLFDLVGNVRQWCQDVSRGDQAPPGGTPYYVTAGSDWADNNEEMLTSAYRQKSAAANVSATLGFRCVLEIHPPFPEKNPAP